MSPDTRRAPSTLPLIATTAALLLAGCDVFTGPGDSPGPAPDQITELPRALSSAELAMLDASNAFGFDLLQEIVRSAPDSTHFLSPLSASMALGMTMNGAAGETLDAMRKTLRFHGLSQEEINASYRELIKLFRGLDPEVSFRIANSVWHREDLTPREAFASAVRESFDAEVRGLNFSAPETPSIVNRWVDEQTEGLIQEIVDDPIPNDMVMYLINAMYFQGDWRNRFDPDRTHDDDFHLPDGSTATARFMTRSGGFEVGWTPDLTVVELPYGGDAFAMTVLVPAEPDELPELVESLDPASWDELVSNVTTADSEVQLFFPRFTVEWERELDPHLQDLGMGIAFIECQADFSGLFETGAQCPHISEVKQKSFVDVDEEGTEAAAVTSVGVRVTSAGPPTSIRVDRPFLFAIRERLSGTILFMGTMSEVPQADG